MLASIDASHYRKLIPDIGQVQFKDFQNPEHIDCIYPWVIHPRSKYWGLSQHSYTEIVAAYSVILKRNRVFIGLCNNTPLFLVELYDPSNDAVSHCYPITKGDIGMHFLLAPPEKKISGLSYAMFHCTIDFIFSFSFFQCIIVEPDISNKKIHNLNIKAGFQKHHLITLPNKTAILFSLKRTDFKSNQDLKLNLKSKEDLINA